MTISIMLVEDNPNHLRYLIRYLPKNKFDHICFTDVDEADAYLLSNSLPDIALIDYDLDTGGFGTDLLGKYAKLFPIIIMTSFVEKSIAKEAIEQGAVNYIAKGHQSWEQIPDLIEQTLHEWNYVEKEIAYPILHDEVYLDMSWRILHFQGRISDKLGYSSKFKNASFIDTFVHPEFREALTAGLLRAFQGFDEYREIKLIAPDGNCEEIWVRVLFKHFINKETQCEQIQLSFSNITELIELRKENLEQLESKVEERTRIYQQAIIQLAHDTRTPLSVINSNLELLKYLTAKILTFEQKEKMKHVLKSLSDGANLLDKNLVGLEQYIREKLKDEKKPNFNNVCIGNITSFLLGQFNSKGNINCNLRDLTKEDYFVIDEEMTKNILVELITNAIKYGGKKKDLIVIHLEIYLFNEKILFNVSDDGRGIEKENHNKIFEDFAQTNTNTDTGLGLGLPLARHRANKMGGHLELIKSIINEGSTFCLSLPARRDR